MKELVERMAQALVDSPDDVSVEETADGDNITFHLRVEQGDLGKVIGRRGRTAAAMRTILSATATKLKKRASLEIVE